MYVSEKHQLEVSPSILYCPLESPNYLARQMIIPLYAYLLMHT